jgi:hypothetical protein
VWFQLSRCGQTRLGPCEKRRRRPLEGLVANQAQSPGDLQLPLQKGLVADDVGGSHGMLVYARRLLG